MDEIEKKLQKIKPKNAQQTAFLEKYSEFYRTGYIPTQQDLADAAEIGQSTVNNYLSKFGLPSSIFTGKSLISNELSNLIGPITTSILSFHIKASGSQKQALRTSLLKEFPISATSPYGIVDIISGDTGLLVITNDALLPNKLKEIKRYKKTTTTSKSN